MSDIVERLKAQMPRQLNWQMRDYPDGRTEGPFDPIRIEAADEITRLREDLAISLSYRDELVSANEGLGVALSEAEQSEKDARRVAIEDCAKVADDVARELYARSGEGTACRIADDIRALQSEER